MERYDVSEGARLAEMVEAARSGEEVLITREGTVVARVAPEQQASEPTKPPYTGRQFLADLDKLRKELPPEVFRIDWTNAVREMRDEERF